MLYLLLEDYIKNYLDFNRAVKGEAEGEVSKEEDEEEEEEEDEEELWLMKGLMKGLKHGENYKFFNDDNVIKSTLNAELSDPRVKRLIIALLLEDKDNVKEYVIPKEKADAAAAKENAEKGEQVFSMFIENLNNAMVPQGFGERFGQMLEYLKSVGINFEEGELEDSLVILLYAVKITQDAYNEEIIDGGAKKTTKKTTKRRLRKTIKKKVKKRPRKTIKKALKKTVKKTIKKPNKRNGKKRKTKRR